MSARRARRTRKKRQRRQRKVNVWRVIVGVAFLAAATIALSGALVIDAVGDNLRGRDLQEIRLGQNTEIFDMNGRRLGRIAGVTNRTEVRRRSIPRFLEEATIAIEDKRFYDHDGVDYYRVVGSAVKNVRGGSTQQGGSTITMQLMRNLYGIGAQRTVRRKLDEVYLALQYEKRFTKNEILTKYLNSVFLGNNAVGVQAASLTYFRRPVSKITLPQAALLAGLPQAPSTYNPFERPQVAKERRNLVLEQMADQGLITRERAEKAKRPGLAQRRARAHPVQREGYISDYVRDVLIERFGEEELQRGGYKVYTTIAPELER